MSEHSSAPQGLPFQVELRAPDGVDQVERVLGRAVNVQLAQAIFKAAINEYPGRRITLTKGAALIADSAG